MKKISGFTLIEVMLAIALLAGAIVALWSILNNCSYLISHARERTIALNHARIISEEIENASNTTLAYARGLKGALTWDAWAKTLFARTLSNEQVSVSFTVTDPDHVTITTSWDDIKGHNCSIKLETMITNK